MEKPSQIICVKCGEKVIARDTWANLSDEELAFVKRKHPRMRWHADCGWNTGCGYTFGLTEQEALDAYAENQKWGMERLRDLETALHNLHHAHMSKNAPLGECIDHYFHKLIEVNDAKE